MASVTSALPTPWRYQGRILESAPGTPDLYDFGARSYNPTIGTFTSLDSLHGSAGNPALLNGYLYANANPATLVDPDGHCASFDGWNGCISRARDTVGDVARQYHNIQADSKAAAQAAALADDRASMTTSVYNWSSNQKLTSTTTRVGPQPDLTPKQLQRQWLITCLQPGNDLRTCESGWLKFGNEPLQPPKKDDSAGEVVGTSTNFWQLPADVPRNELWWSRYTDLVTKEKALGYSETTAQKIAAAFVKQQFKGGAGAAWVLQSKQLGVIAIAADVGLTAKDCDWNDGFNCVAQVTRAGVSDGIGWGAGSAFTSACLPKAEGSPWVAAGCVAGGVGVGVGLGMVTSALWDDVGCNFDRNCPKLSDYIDAAEALSNEDKH